MLPPKDRAPRKKIRRKSGTSSGGGGGPQGTGRTSGADASAPRKKRVKAPSKQQVKNAKAQQQGYVSQGRAVENVANQQRKVRLAKGQQAGYVSQAQAVEREARKRTGRGVILRQAKKELEGKGALAEGLGKLGDLVERTAVLQSTGGGPGAAAAGVKLGGGRLSPGAATALAPRPLKVEGTAAGRALSDVVNFPAVALPSVYEPVAGTVEAAQGRPERLKKIAKQIDESDPVFNLAAAGVEAVKGNEKAAKKRLKRAEDAASEHPGLTALEIAGPVRGASMGAGALGRAGIAGSRVKRLVSTERESRTMPGTDLVEARDYHRDPLIKAAQVIGEKIRPGGPGARMTDREIRRRVDERVQISRDLDLPEDATIAEFALRGRKSGKVRAFKSPEKAQSEAGPEFTPVRLAELDRWTAIPKVAADRLEEHRTVGSSGGGIKTLQLANQQFRDVVLSTSPGWFAGNVIEGLGRAALAHAGPRSYVTGRRVLKRIRTIDPATADEAAARLVPGGYGAMSERVSIKPDFSGTDLAPVANALSRLWKAPGPKQAADVWHRYTHFVFRALNGRIESHIQSAMLGSALRKSNLMDGNLLKLSEKAIDQAAEGLRQTAEQVRFARKVRDMYGKYDSFKPSTRKAIATYTPFVPWFLSALKFVTQVLPRDHPVVTALIAQAEIAADEWLKDHGLGVFVKGALPGFLQGSIPMSEGRHLRVSKFTPFGAFQSLPETAAGQVMPMWQSIGFALEGKSWTGREMRVETQDGTRPANDVERSVAAAHAFLQGQIPGLSVGERVNAKGPSALNPFNPTSSPKTKTKKIRKSSRPAGTIVGPGASSSGSGATDVFGRSTSGSSDEKFYGGSSTSDDSVFFGK
jgi:hypothetical protein